MNLLISWIGKHDCESATRQVEPYGPIETILAKGNHSIDEVYAFYQYSYIDRYELNLRRYLNKIKEKYNCTVDPIAMQDDLVTSDITVMHKLMSDEVAKILATKRKATALYFNTSSGTNAITVSFIILGRTQYDATLLQTWTDTPRKTSNVEEVNFPFSISFDVLQKQLPADTQMKRQVLYGDVRGKEIIGECEAIKSAINDVRKYAMFDRNVLITGESGTGKELFAQLYRDASARDNNRFFSFNCANLPDTLAESELFGHIKGSFTDAKEDRLGLFKQAHKGILFLDEIGELSHNLQAKLLRVLEDGIVKPIGSDKGESVDVRLVSATNSPDKLRLDLFFRLSEGIIELPPLRSRGKDVVIIADKCLEDTNKELSDLASKAKFSIVYQAKSFDKTAYEFIMSHQWEGNVRELISVVKRCCILSSDPLITADTLARESYKKRPTENNTSCIRFPISEQLRVSIEEKCNLMNDIQKIKLEAIRESIETSTSQSQAARKLGFKTLQAMQNHLKQEKP